MKKIKRPLALAGLSAFFADLVMILISPTAIVPAVMLLTLLTAFFALKRKQLAAALLLAVVCAEISGISFNFQLLYAERTFALEGEEQAKIAGRVYDYPVKNGKGSTRLTLYDFTVNGRKAKGKINVYIKERIKAEPGDSAELTASRVVRAESSGEYKYHRLSGRENLTAPGAREVSVTKREKETLTSKIFALRKATADKIRRHVEKTSADIAVALITGDRTMLSPEIKNGLRVSGVSHIFAVSGMHLTLWTGILFALMMRRSRTKLLPNIAASAFVIFYMIFTGLSPSVMRAGIMLLAVFAGAAIKRKADALNSLGLAAFILLTANPFLAGNISFLLSFTATFALTALVPAVYVSEKQDITRSVLLQKAKRGIKSSLLVSFAVMFTVLPLSAVFFGYVSLLTPVSALFLTVVSEALMVLSGIGILLPDGFFLSRFVFKLSQTAASAIAAYTGKMRNFDFALLPLNKKIILPWFFITAVISAALYFMSRKNSRLLLCSLLSCSLLLTLVSIGGEMLNSRDMLVYIPKAGNCTCFCVSGSSGAPSLIYGAGGSYDAGRKISRFLGSKSAVFSDYMIIQRSVKTESENTEYFENTMFPKKLLKLYAKNDAEAAIFSARLKSGADIVCETSENFSAAALYINGKKLVVCSLPSSDFTAAGNAFADGDILICRSSVPKTINRDNFGYIVIMSEYSPQTRNASVMSTADGDILITLKGERKCPLSVKRLSGNQ